MNILDNHLLVYTADNVLRYYIIKIVSPTKIRLSLQQQLSLVNMIQTPEYVSSISWFPPPSVRITAGVLKSCPILFLRNGELSMIRPVGGGEDESIGGGEYEHVKLAEQIEFFWLSARNEERMADLYNSLWAFNGTGVKIWTNLIISDEIMSSRFQWKSPKSHEHAIYMDLNFYPLSMLIVC
jgi:hypothetical protein